MSYRLRNFVIAAVLALLAGLLTTIYVSGYKHRIQRGEQLVPVLVATKDIPVGTSSAKVTFAERKVPQRSLVAGAVSNKQRLAGLVTQTPIFAGEQITMRRFASIGALGPRAAVHGTSRLIAVPGDNNELLAGVLHTGDRVDVVAALPVPNSQIKPTKVILTNVRVVRPAQQSAAASSKLASSGSQQTLAIFLSVTDEQARKLYFAEVNGTWTVVLRPIDGSAK
jgi:pilus assembly protein CpaB